MKSFVSLFKPSAVVADITGISAEWLRSRGVTTIGFDLDRTIIGHFDEKIPANFLNHLHALHQASFKIVIISNVHTAQRQTRFNKIINDVIISGISNVVTVTPKDTGGKGKPSSAPFKLAAQLSVSNLDSVCYVGDQLLKDVYGAANAGYSTTVLVRPYGKGDNPAVLFLQRPTIDLFFKLYHRLPIRKSSYLSNIKTQ